MPLKTLGPIGPRAVGERVKDAQGLGSANADSSSDPESKSGPKWPGSGSGVLIRPRMAWIRTPFFFLLVFLSDLMPLTTKERDVMTNR